MKIFIFILYVLFIFIIPQLYTWLIRIAKEDYEVQAFFIIFGAGIIILLTIGFTILLTQWQIISITL